MSTTSTDDEGGSPSAEKSLPSAWSYRTIREASPSGPRKKTPWSFSTHHIAAAVVAFFLLVSGYYLGTYYLDVRPSVQVLETHFQTVDELRWSTDGRRMAVWSRRPGAAALSPAMQIWEVGEGRLLREYPKHGSFLEAAAMSPAGDRTALCFPDSQDALQHTLVLHEIAHAKETRVRFAAPIVARLEFSPDASTLAVLSDQILLFDAHSGALRDSIQFPTIVYQFELAFRGPSILVMSVVSDTVRVDEYYPHRTRMMPSPEGIEAPRAAFSANAEYLVVAAGDSAYTYATRSGVLLHRVRLPKGYTGPVSITSDGKRLAAHSPQGAVVLIHAATSAALVTCVSASGAPLDAGFSRDGGMFAAVDAETGTVDLYETSRGAFDARYVHRESLWEDPEKRFRFSFSDDGARLATASSRVRIWKAR